MLVLGLDPGSHGGFVVVDSRGKIVDTYVFSGASKDEMFINYFNQLKVITKPTVAYVEDVHAIHGSSASSTFSFGRNFQMAIDVLLAYGIRVVYVAPRVWQKTFFEGVPQHIKKGTKNKRDTKRMAYDAAKKLFSMDVFLKSKRSTKPHDGLIDAALIATYGLKIEKGELK